MIEFSTTTSLLPHQREAVEKLKASRVGALFMEMGTGKTRTAFELVRMRSCRVSRVVYFCPVSLRYVVLAELMRHTDVPSERVCVLSPGMDDASIPHDAEWYVCGMESMGGSDAMYMAARRVVTADTYAIVDESTYIKGYTSKRTARITAMCRKCRYRLIMTGTPITQGIVDLYSQMSFLSQDILGYRSFYSFSHKHIRYSEKYPGLIDGYLHADWIAARIQPYVYQVLKSECLELPQKTYRERYFRMTHQQAWLYDDVKEEMLNEMCDMESTRSERVLLIIFKLFTKLQQVCCGYLKDRGRLVEVTHNRLDLLEEVLDEFGDEKAIIWAKDIYSINEIATLLGSRCVTITGDTTTAQRTERVGRFADDIQYLVATPSCMGHGFTFNFAHKMVFYNNGFKHSERVQAEDRIHRIGQTEQCEYVSLTCENSVDERIMRALACKKSALTSFRDDVEEVKDKKGRFSKDKLKKIFERL